MPRSAVVCLFVAAAVLALGGLRVIQSTPEKAGRDAFAQDRAAAVTDGLAFDGDRALGYLNEICKIGPRISGTEGMKRQQALVKKHFQSQGATIEFQRFHAQQESQRQPVEMANLVISWHPAAARRVILCSHYDTRPIADQEDDRRNWNLPFVSANDGGSGVALLMELANHMKDLKLNVGVDFVLFDGEEYIFESKRDKYFLGSEHFAEVYRRNRAKPQYIAAVLLDMIGGKNAHFPVEQNSWMKAGALVQDIWNVARELKCAAFEDRFGDSVLDDHLALNNAGIPAVDIIDFRYPHWHRLTDVHANCSKESLTEVARVLTVWLQRLK